MRNVSSSKNHIWLTNELKEEVRKNFEPRYKRKLADSEIIEIAENLADFVESYLKFKWRQKNEANPKVQKPAKNCT